MSRDLGAIEADKKKAAGASLAYNIIATLAKVVAAVVTGSVSLLSEAVHSGTDIVSSLIGYLSIRISAVPPDEEHPFGHGKVESLAGLAESVMLLAIVTYIAIESVMKLLHGSALQSLEIGIVVMALSAVTSFLTSIYVGKVGRRTDSLALTANGQHLLVDAVTSVGVLIALAVVHVTGWSVADPIIALLFAGWMAFGAIKLSAKAIHDLLDVRLPKSEVERIGEILKSDKSLLSYHRLRTRRSGSMRYVDVHIVVPNDWSVIQAHDLADRLEKRIESDLAPAQAVIHVDPFEFTKISPE